LTAAASIAYVIIGVAQEHGIIASMSNKGSCYDNAMVETVFKTIKSELIWRAYQLQITPSGYKCHHEI